jgi:predicted nucleic acid-binding protein
MIDKVFFDTNILIYLFDKSDKQKQDVIKKVISEHFISSQIFLSVQVINEFINVTTRKIDQPISFTRLKEIIEILDEMFIISSISLNTTLKAVEISKKYKLSHWDSLIISSALEARCNILYSEDMQHNFLIEEKLRIVNPFKL